MKSNVLKCMMEKNEDTLIQRFLTSDCYSSFQREENQICSDDGFCSLKCPPSSGTLHFSHQMLEVVDEKSPSSEHLGLSVLPVGRGTPCIPQTSKLGFEAVQGYLFLVRLITLVLVSVLHQIQVALPLSPDYISMSFPPYISLSVNTLKKQPRRDTWCWTEPRDLVWGNGATSIFCYMVSHCFLSVSCKAFADMMTLIYDAFQCCSEKSFKYM